MPNIKIIVLVGVALISAGMFIISGYYIYPVPGGDTSAYTQAGINFARSGVLTSSFLEDAYMDRIDTSGARRFLLHPPLFQAVLGKVLKATTPYQAFMYIAVMHMITTLLFLGIIYRAITRQNQSLSWSNMIIILLSTVALVAYLIGNAGRQETLPHLLYAAGLASMLFIDVKYVWIVLGILLGATGAAHPIAAVMYGFIVGLFFAIKLNVRPAIVYTGLSYLLSIVIFFILMSLMPFPIGDIIKGITNQSGTIVEGFSVRGIVGYMQTLIPVYITNANTPFLGIMLILIIACGFSRMKQYMRKNDNNILLYFFGVLLTTVILFIFYRASEYYNYLIVVPFGLFLILYVAVQTRSRIIKGMIICVLGIASIGLVRYVVLFKFFRDDGMLLDEARYRFMELKSSLNPNTHFVVSNPLWMISEDYTRMSSSPPRALKGSPFVLLAQENYGGTPYAAPTRSINQYTCALKNDLFTHKQPSLLGIKLANTTPGYAFAVYECTI